ncbi:MAG: GTP pyrophosphokinase family protein [Thermoflexaceae bacterium]|nr:GTP pyrophosphokinase family protein [Thermoflexaceae bacterium]
MDQIFSYEVADALTRQNGSEFRSQAEQFRELMMMYSCAIKEVRTKIEVLSEEFQVKSQRNPIGTIKSRIKQPMSIFEKAKRKGYELTFESIKENMNDIAGIRVICPFIEDIYAVAEMLTNQDDIRMIQVKDYIQHPKDNGYRSLHIVVEVPIFLSDRKEYMKVEVQIRTIAMDFWASLEHQIHYKKYTDNEDEAIVKELKECADTIYETDKKMESIRRKLDYVEDINHII